MQQLSTYFIYLFLFIYLFPQKTTIITVTKVPVHELDKKGQ